MKQLKLIVPTLMAFAFSSCIYMRSGNVTQTANGSVSPGKQGLACTTGIGSLVAWGDSSLSAAAENGGISQIASVEWYNEAWILGFYNKHCTLIKGT